MKPAGGIQGEFDFHQGDAKGYDHWLAGRKRAVAELARRLNLPLQHPVEVWLTGGIRLRGRLQLQEEKLFLEATEERGRDLGLRVDQVTFTFKEMESCVRLD